MQDFDKDEFEAFKKIHQAQLENVGFPKDLYSRLYMKLKNEEFDIGTKVKLLIDKDVGKMMVSTTEKLDKEEDVFLIDHAWTFRYYEAYKMLKENKKLRYRMKNITSYAGRIDLASLSNQPSMMSDENAVQAIPEEYREDRPNLLKYLETMPDGPTIYNLDEYGIVSLENIPFKDNATEISLYGNRINDPYTVTDNLLKIETLKALWLNDNPIEETCHNFDEIGEYLKSLEIINSKFTSKAGEWALLFCCKDQKIDSLDKIYHLDLSSREFLKMKDLSIFEQITNLHTLDISDHKNLIKKSEEESKGTEEKEIEGQKFEVTGHSHSLINFFKAIPQIQHLICEDDVVEYIIDKHKAGKLDEFLPNIKTVNKIPIPKTFNDYKVDKEVQTILKDLWKFACTYRFSTTNNVQDQESYWYIMDEVGSALMHSDVSNVEVHPFIYCRDLVAMSNPNNYQEVDPTLRITYSILWPKKDIAKEELLYRDFLPKVTEDEFRSAKLCVWFITPEKYYEQALQTFRDEVQATKDKSGEFEEKFQENQAKDGSFLDELKNLGRPVKIFPYYFDIPFGEEIYSTRLNDDLLVTVGDEDEADVVISVKDFKTTTNVVKLNPEKHVFNQFPYEAVLVMKHCLQDCIRKIYGTYPGYQESYYGVTHLPAFIGRFKEREKLKLENTWILKPVNASRSSDHVITNNLDCIIRHMETAPRVIQKYLDDPFLIDNKKIDIRLWVVVRSFSPLELYIHKYCYARISSKDFDMNEENLMDWKMHFGLEDRDKGKYNVGPMFDAVVDAFNKTGEDGWKKMEEKIHKVIKDVFKAAVLYKPEIHNEKSRAVYGIDIIVDEKLNPYKL